MFSHCLLFYLYNCRRELVHPLDICIFYRYRFLAKGSENDLLGVRAHLHARIKEVSIQGYSSSFFFFAKYLQGCLRKILVDLSMSIIHHIHHWQLGISLTELSLDILLFVIGKLKLAGPFAVRNSAIFANCCKVVNSAYPFHFKISTRTPFHPLYPSYVIKYFLTLQT